MKNHLIFFMTMIRMTICIYNLKSLKEVKRTVSVISRFASNNHCVINGDSKAAKTYEGLMKHSALADALITDPPYCILERRRKGGDLRDPKRVKKKLDDDDSVTRFESVKSFTAFTKEWLQVAVKYVKPTAPLIIWTNALGKVPTINLCKQLNYTFVDEYLWAKRTKVMNKDEVISSTKNEVLLRIYETALVFRPNSQPPLTAPEDGEPAIPWSCVTGYHDEASTDVNGEKMSITAHLHPCHKPFECIEPLIRTWTKPEDIILDCFVGSGGIVCSAAKLGRTVKGIEILAHWAEYTKTKLDSFENDKAKVHTK